MNNKITSIGDWTSRENPPPIDDADIPPEHYSNDYGIPVKKGTPASGVKTQSGNKDFVIYGVRDFLRLQFPERKYLLDPILEDGSLVQFYGAAGLGKTMLGLHVAHSVATGTAMFDDGTWKAEKPLKVIYVDGEMCGKSLQSRMRSIGNKAPENENLVIFSALEQPRERQIPNLATPEGQQAIDYVIDPFDLVIVDNVSSLMPFKWNEPDKWKPVKDWLLDLRRRGKACILFNHANKATDLFGGSDYRGATSQIDILDLNIELRKPLDYAADRDGCRFEVHFRKSRGLWGDKVKPFELTLFNDGGQSKWIKKPVADRAAQRQAAKDEKMEEIIKLLEEGESRRYIANKLGVSSKTITEASKMIKLSDGNFDDGI